MFFILSKIIGFFALPSNVLISIGIAGLVLLCTRFRRLASWLLVTSIALIAVAGSGAPSMRSSAAAMPCGSGAAMCTSVSSTATPAAASASA